MSQALQHTSAYHLESAFMYIVLYDSAASQKVK